MTDSAENKHIIVKKHIYKRLETRKRPQQGFSGVIEELLDIVEHMEQETNSKSREIIK